MKLTRKWISFRDLFDDPNEPADKGISLENPVFRKYPNTVEFAVTEKPYLAQIIIKVKESVDSLECVEDEIASMPEVEEVVSVESIS